MLTTVVELAFGEPGGGGLGHEHLATVGEARDPGDDGDVSAVEVAVAADHLAGVRADADPYRGPA